MCLCGVLSVMCMMCVRGLWFSVCDVFDMCGVVCVMCLKCVVCGVVLVM